MNNNEARLKAFAELAEDWDSYGAKPISPVAIETARAVLAAMKGEPWAVPTADGGVSLEWAADDFSVEISAEGHATLWFSGNAEDAA